MLVNGASGGVGTFAVQLAKAMGASDRGDQPPQSGSGPILGADEVIDYTKTDFTRGAQRYHLILAANGYHPISQYKRASRQGWPHVHDRGDQKQMAEAIFLGPNSRPWVAANASAS